MKELERMIERNSIEGYYRRQEYNFGDECQKTTDGCAADAVRLLMSSTGDLYLQYGEIYTETGDNPVNDGNEVWEETVRPFSISKWIEKGGNNPFPSKYGVTQHDYRSCNVLAKSNRTSKGHGYTTVLTTAVK